MQFDRHTIYTFLTVLALALPLAAAGDRPADVPDDLAHARDQMLRHHLAARGIDGRIVEAMGRVPRESFVPPGYRQAAYADRPLPIGYGQTISQPYIVALMTNVVEPQADDVALEIGTGSGYQAAVLAELVDTVYSVEIIPELTERATAVLRDLGYDNVVAETRDGYRGWPEHAPFDVIVVTAAPDHVPQPLVDQLAPGGRMVIPVGDRYQQLKLIRKDERGQVVTQTVVDVQFVPMTGEAQQRSR